MNKFRFNLQLFGSSVQPISPINVTTQTGSGKDMSPTMKEFYDTTLLENARSAMVFTELGLKQPMKGNKCEWRKFNTFAKALTPLTEGVIPDGSNFGMTKIEAEITQHGDYTAVSDRLEMESFDDVIFGATEEMGAAEGETYDTLTRNALLQGTSVAYADKNGTAATSRTALTNDHVLTPDLVAKAVTWLKKNKAPKINGYYVAIIHPSQAYDLRKSDDWIEAHKYADVTPIYNGEIGTLHGCRFIESTESKVYDKNETTAKVAAYAALFMGKDAFGVLDPEGEGMEMIVKPADQIGGPLNQFSTIGYKFCHGAKILYQERLLRVETGSSYGSVDEEN